MLYKTVYKESCVHVLERDQVKYSVHSDNESEIQFCIPDSINSDILTEDIACEEQRQQSQAKIPVYSKRTLEDKEKLERLRNYYGKKGFHVLEKDEEASRAAGLI